MSNYSGDSGDNSQAGSAGEDNFDYSQGGHDTLSGGDDDDFFQMGAALDPLDVLDGGDAVTTDAVGIAGDYSAGLTITTSMFIGIEGMVFDSGDYGVKLGDGVAIVGRPFLVTLLPGATGVLDASAFTSAGVDVAFNLGVQMRVIGGGGDDSFSLNTGDRHNIIVGGGGDDQLDLQVIDRFKAAGHTFSGIETLRLVGPSPVVLADGNVAAGETLAITVFSPVTADLDGHKELDGHYTFAGEAQADRMVGGHLSDTLAGGGSADTLTGGGGADQLTGGTGADLFVFRLVGDSAIGAADLITDLEAGDQIDLSAIDADKHQPGLQHFVLVEAFDGHAGQVTLTYDAGAGVTRLLADVNDDGDAEMEIDIAGDHADFSGLVF